LQNFEFSGMLKWSALYLELPTTTKIAPWRAAAIIFAPTSGASAVRILVPPCRCSRCEVCELLVTLGSPTRKFSMIRWFDCSASNTLRPPDWRWQMALLLASGRFLPPGCGDWSVGKARQFLSNSRAARTTQQRVAVVRQFPRIYPAWLIYAVRGERRELRAELEARLLANEPVAEIARKNSLNESVITVYTSIFFDIANRLTAPSWIKHFVVDAAHQEGLAASNKHAAWKALGYAYGPAMVDFLVSGSGEPVKHVSAGELPDVITSDIMLQVKRQTLLALNSPNLDQRTINQIIACYHAVQK